MTNRRPTSLDIAYLAGVSQATVSRALRGSELVSEATRERIVKIAKELNYRTDRNAANLRSQRTNTLALLLFEDETEDDSHINPFFLSLLGSITRAASRQGYDLLVSFQRMDEDWHTEYEVSNRADGIILLGYGNFTDYGEKFDSLIDASAHFVIWGPHRDDDDGHCLCADNVGGGLVATRHLLKIGRRRIAFIGAVSDGFPEFHQRYEGYVAALKEAGVAFDPALRVDAGNLESSGAAAVESLLDAGHDIDAVFTATDTIAIGAIKALRNRGIKVPGEVSIVGFDDSPMAAIFDPPLTTVHQNTSLAGRTLVANLIAQIKGESIVGNSVPVELRVRASCGADRIAS